MKPIPIHGKSGKGKFAIVDDEDFERCNEISWCLSNNRAMAKRKINGKWKTILMHRFVLGFPDSPSVDHINNNPLDNRKSNLRLCSNAENLRNRPPLNGRRLKGVRKKGNKWEGRIKVAKKYIHLGRFETEIEAAKAYNEAAKTYFKQFAWLNPI